MRNEFWPHTCERAKIQDTQWTAACKDKELADAIKLGRKMSAKYAGSELGERCAAVMTLKLEEQARRTNT